MKRFLLIGLILLISILLILGRFLLPKKKGEKVAKSFSEIKVEIINCSGVYEIGKEVMEDLRRRGFNVYDVLFDPDTLAKTVVVERSDEQMTNALILAKSIAKRKKVGILPREEVLFPELRKEIDNNLLIDVSLILGKDFPTFFPNIPSGQEMGD